MPCLISACAPPPSLSPGLVVNALWCISQDYRYGSCSRITYQGRAPPTPTPTVSTYLVDSLKVNSCEHCCICIKDCIITDTKWLWLTMVLESLWHLASLQKQLKVVPKNLGRQKAKLSPNYLQQMVNVFWALYKNISGLCIFVNIGGPHELICMNMALVCLKPLKNIGLLNLWKKMVAFER